MLVEHAAAFRELFSGRSDAYGLGSGGVRHGEVTARMYLDHLKGTLGADFGVFPMRPDDTVLFAAIDLDETNYDLAVQLARKVPGCSWVERSRSKGYHVWAFFSEPCPAWAARAVLKGVTLAVGRTDIEIFPKQERLLEGMVGNYINLPLFGEERPIVYVSGHQTYGECVVDDSELPTRFLEMAISQRTDPDLWVRRARALGATEPSERAPAEDFGTRSRPHRCAEYVIAHMHDNPLTPGHRAVVLFNLAKQILNCEHYDKSEALDIVEAVNQAGTSPVPRHEVERFVRNAARGEWTSTGCDDPAFQPFADPDCPIANGGGPAPKGREGRRRLGR